MNTPPARSGESAGGVAIPATRYAPEVVGTESTAMPPPMNTPASNAGPLRDVIWLDSDPGVVGVPEHAAVPIRTATLAPRRMCLIAVSFWRGRCLAAKMRRCQN